MVGTDEYSGILFRIMCLHQQHIRQYERVSHGGRDPTSEKDCSFVDEGGQTSAFSSSFVVPRHCYVMSSFESVSSQKSHNHLDVA